jgi:hypothetical protein
MIAKTGDAGLYAVPPAEGRARSATEFSRTGDPRRRARRQLGTIRRAREPPQPARGLGAGAPSAEGLLYTVTDDDRFVV